MRKLGGSVKKSFVAIAVSAAVLLQSQAAMAACASANVTGTWNLVGTLFNGNGTGAYAFWCPSVVVVATPTANKYGISPAAACTARSAGLTGAWTVTATNTITINPTTCKVTGTFVMNHPAGPITVSATINTGILENPVGAAKSTRGQFAANAASNIGTVAFTLQR
jgi:hypothetical protein